MNNEFYELNSCIPELRYIFFHLKNKKRVEYIKYARTGIVDCLQRVALNLAYAVQARISLSKTQIGSLKPYKKKIKALIAAKTIKEKKKILTNSLVEAMLKIILSKRILDQLGIDY